MGAVVLAHGPPLALAQVRSPELPALLAACVFGESHPLGRSGLALGSGLDRHAHDSVLILDQHGSPPHHALPQSLRCSLSLACTASKGSRSRMAGCSPGKTSPFNAVKPGRSRIPLVRARRVIRAAR